MTQKTVLIVGAGPDQIPAIRRAREMGCRTAAIDRNPQAPGFAHADVTAAISTADKEAVLAFAAQTGVNAILTLISETGVPTVAYVARRLGLPAISERTAYWATNKNAMRMAFAVAKVPTPDSAPFSSLAEAEDFVSGNGYPIVVKPSDGSGQSGATLVQAAGQLPEAVAVALQWASDGKGIIEAYVPGPEINVTAVVHKKQIRILSLSNRVTAPLPHFGIAIRHILPPDIDATLQSRVMAAAAQAIRAIELEEGIAYPQIVVGREGPCVIEIAARIPGGYMREIALFASGVDMIDVALRQALALPFELPEPILSPPAAVVEFLTALSVDPSLRQVSTVTGLAEAAAMPGIDAVHCMLKPGDPIPPLNSSRARFGAVIATGRHREETLARAQAAAKTIRIE